MVPQSSVEFDHGSGVGFNSFDQTIVVLTLGLSETRLKIVCIERINKYLRLKSRFVRPEKGIFLSRREKIVWADSTQSTNEHFPDTINWMMRDVLKQ